jgi:hypothetical protein
VWVVAGSQYAAVSSQSLGSAGGSMEFSGSPDSPYGGSNQYMNAERTAGKYRTISVHKCS